VPAWLLASLRTAAQFVVTSVVAWLTTRGIVVPEALQGWFAETVLFAGAIAGITAGLHWLETRQGNDVWSRLFRAVAKVAMLGLSGKRPVYLTPADADDVEATVRDRA
jgi:predicted Na+-dependent transporter